MECKDSISWNALIHGFLSLEEPLTKDKTYMGLLQSGFSIVASVQNSLLSMYVKFVNLNYAQKLFDEMCERDVISWSSLMSGYTRCGNATNALRLFRSMYVDLGNEMDGLATVCVLQACANAGDIDNGRSIHTPLIRKGFEEDVFVENSSSMNFLQKHSNLYMGFVGFVEWHDFLHSF